MALVFAVVHDTFEKGSTPVVRHVFAGKTLDKARRYYAAHRRSDAFMRQCDDQGNFAGRVPCHTRVHETEMSGRQLAALDRGQLAGQLGAASEPCRVGFWRFAGAVSAGSVAGLGASWIASKAWPDETTAQKVGAAFIKLGAFWIVGGLTWVALSHASVE
jgi:hypothetical protein